jgi:hypothetical protein
MPVIFCREVLVQVNITTATFLSQQEIKKPDAEELT